MVTDSNGNGVGGQTFDRYHNERWIPHRLVSFTDADFRNLHRNLFRTEVEMGAEGPETITVSIAADLRGAATLNLTSEAADRCQYPDH